MLSGKIALVTGGSRGIGKAISIELARNGATVVVNATTSKILANQVCSEIVESGGNAIPYIADVSDIEQVKNMVSMIEKKYGRIDILINNAGISPKKDGKKVPVFDLDPSEWNQVIQINLNGVFYCTRYVAPIMVKNRWGRIVNMSSQAGRTQSPFVSAHYSASKAGILGITRQTALELADYNIIANTVAPGRIATDMNRSVDEETNREINRTIPLGKAGSAEGVARLVRFLVSEENDFIVGATIDINGGQRML